jgi:aminopeptidase N
MIRAIDAHRAGHTSEVDSLVEALATGLRSSIASVDDPLLLAQLLAVPDEYMLGDRDAVIDVDGVAKGLHMLRVRLGAELAEPLLDLWQRSIESERAVGSGVAAIAVRMLVEPVLALLLAGGGDAESLAQRAVAHHEPTVGIRAFAQLAHIDSVDLDALIADTFVRWQHSPRLTDRWLRAISGARRLDTIDRVRGIVAGPLYDRDDRSRVMAVWFPFATRNRAVFHEASGAGYRLFVDELAELLGTNAGTAVRLVGDLLQFKRFDAQRSALMRAELERLVTMPALPDFAVGILQHLLAQ